MQQHIEETHTDTEVLVVGAGPTGLTLAVELARRGVPCRVVEASTRPQIGSRGKGIQPRTLEVFDDLGIADRLVAYGRFAMPVRITGPGDAVVEPAPVTFADRPDVPYPASLLVPEFRVEQVLRDRLAELGGHVEFGTALESFHQDAEHDGVETVLVHDDVRTTVSARWLVGADGGHSLVRKGSGIAFDGETLEDVRMIVADLPVDGLDRQTWQMWRHEHGPVMLAPLPSTDVWQYQAPIAPGQDPSLALSNMQAVLDERSGRTDIRLGEPVWSSLWRANIRIVDRYRDGRVLLAGDAAHIHSPAGGQGMNTGIQDAHNLGWKLAAVHAGAPEDLLNTYGEERRPVAEAVLALSNARLRETIDHGRIPITASPDTMQLTVGYRWSSLAVDDRPEPTTVPDPLDGPVRAGDRFPDVPGLHTADRELHLFDLTRGGGWMLLRFGDAPDVDGVRSLHVVDTATAPDEVGDPDERLAVAFGVRPGALVLLRPDGFVGVVATTDVAASVGRMLLRVGVR